MKTHCMDVLVLLLALLSVVTVTFLEFNNSPIKSETEISYGVTCWVPAFFTQNYVDYTNSYCAKAWKTGDVYNVPHGRQGGKITKRGKNDQKEEDQEKMVKGDSQLKSLLLGQTVVAVITFAVLQMVVTSLVTKTLSLGFCEKDNETNIHEDVEAKKLSVFENQDYVSRRSRSMKKVSRSKSLTIIYCWILLVAANAWFILAAKSHSVMEDRKGSRADETPTTNTVEKCKNCTDNQTAETPETDTNKEADADMFLCDFSVRQMGNVHKHTVQCVTNPQQENEKTAQRIVAAELNSAICFTIAFLLLIHLLYTLVVAPLVNGVVDENGKKLFMSDVNLSMTVGAF